MSDTVNKIFVIFAILGTLFGGYQVADDLFYSNDTLVTDNYTIIATVTESAFGTRIDYPDDTFEINYHGNNYKTWEGVWESKDTMEVGTTHYPYLIADGGTQWTLSKNGEFLTLPKNSVYSYSFDPYHIGMTITATPTQLNSISTYQNVAGEDVWYIVIPDQLVHNAKVFNWDNKLPIVINQLYEQLNQSNFEYHKVDNENRFYYNQDARDFGISSSEIIFEFNSWYVVGSGGSGFSDNVTTDYTIITGNQQIVLDLEVQGYSSMWDFRGGSGTVLWDSNRTSANDGIITGSGNWISGRGYNFVDSSINVGSDLSNPNKSIFINFTTDSYGDYGLLISNRNSTVKEMEIFTEVGNLLRSQHEAGTTDADTYNSLTYSINRKIIIVFNSSEKTIRYYNPEQESYGDLDIGTDNFAQTTIDTCIGNCITGGRKYDGKMYRVIYYERILNQTEKCSVYNLSRVLSGNLTQNIYDSGAGNEIQKIGNNGTFADGTVSVDLQINSSADNSSWTGWYTVQSNVTSGTIYDVPAGYQKRYFQIRSILSTTDASKTPIITNIRSLMESVAPPVGAPDTKFEYWDGAAWTEGEALDYLYFDCFWWTKDYADGVFPNAEQSVGQPTLKITNNGTADGVPHMYLNVTPPANVRIFVDNDSTFDANSIELTNISQAVHFSIDNTTNVTFWSWVNLTGADNWDFELYANVTDV